MTEIRELVYVPAAQLRNYREVIQKTIEQRVKKCKVGYGFISDTPEIKHIETKGKITATGSVMFKVMYVAKTVNLKIGDTLHEPVASVISGGVYIVKPGIRVLIPLSGLLEPMKYESGKLVSTSRTIEIGSMIHLKITVTRFREESIDGIGKEIQAE